MTDRVQVATKWPIHSSASPTATSTGIIMKSSSTQCRCGVFRRKFAAPIAARSPRKLLHTPHGNPSKKKSAISGEMRENTMRTVARSRFSQASWRQVLVRTTHAPFTLTPNQQHFNRRVTEAKKLVPNPIQVDDHPETETPRIKLKMGARNPEPAASKLTLKMRGQTSETPSKDDGPRSGVTVDNESLKRQQELVRAGSASQDVDVPQMSPRTRSLRRHVESPKSSTATTPSASEQLHSVPIHGRDLTGPIKDETPLAHSQNPETRSSHGLHEALLDSTGGISSYDGKESTWQPPTAFPLSRAYADSLLPFSTVSTIPRTITIGFSLEAARCRLEPHPQVLNNEFEPKEPKDRS